MDAEAWRAAKGVLAEALACPPAERDALLDARCTDPALRREVQAYLNEYDEHFLESVLTVSERLDSTSSPGGGAEHRLDIRNGDRIGPYVVLGQLGAGGMGHVFLGDDTRLHRKVALKCLSASASAGELRARILHEARAAARITHPNIAIVHDVVEHDERPFLVMEYVEGESLAALIRRERPPLERIVAFVRQLASALAAAHAKGIVHRDLKPANIQVTPDGSVKILDFGVAHAMSAAALSTTTSPAADLTVTLGTIGGGTLQADRRVMHPGTPAYMSPEQMFGREIDQRSDIYSLGVIVYEMATGHRPYATDDPLEVVLTLSKNFLNAGDPQTNVPAQINEIVSKMLAVRPEDRYQTAGELENALITLTARAEPEPAVQAAPRLRIARALSAVLVTAVAITLLGYNETRAFNLTLGRVPPFDYEPPVRWIQYGAQSLVLPGVYVLGFFMLMWMWRFVRRLLGLSDAIDRLCTRTVTQSVRVSQKLDLDDPAVFGQAVVAVGTVLLLAVVLRHLPLIRALFATSISTKPRATFLPFQAGPPRLALQWYQFLLVALTAGFAAAAIRLRRLRALSPVTRGRAALAGVLVMMCVALVLCEWPYRLIYQSRLPRVDVSGKRCFELGAAGEDLLIHCPDDAAPRNRIVRRNDPAVSILGISENIFDPAPSAGASTERIQ